LKSSTQGEGWDCLKDGVTMKILMKILMKSLNGYGFILVQSVAGGMKRLATISILLASGA
jgi:hypothetical protein